MAKVIHKTLAVCTALKQLDYYHGPVSSDYLDPAYRRALRAFQSWAKRVLKTYKGKIDGWYGLKSEAALLPLIALIEKHAPCGFKAFRIFQQTYYYLGRARAGNIPMRTPKGKSLAMVSPGSFVEAALEGTTKLRDGRIANVASGPRYSRVDPAVYQPVYDIAARNNWIARGIPGYAGITLSRDKKRVSKARNFYIKKPGPGGFPIERKGIEMDEWRTIATDNGRLRRHSKRWKGKGGVIPNGTRCWLLDYVGIPLPDGTLHDGWVVSNDTGGGIYGRHFDMFIGFRSNRTKADGMARRSRIHLWFEGCEKKIDPEYQYGLK